MATVVRIGHSYDGPQWTVSQMVKAPTRIPTIVVQAVKDNLIADVLLRTGPDAPGGAVQYQEQIAFASARDAEIIAEFGEIPSTQSDISMPVVAATQKRGLGLKISKEMETRNDIGRVAQEISLTRDAMIRAWNKVFFQAVYRNGNILTMNASRQATGGWTTDVVPATGLTPTAGIRRDLAQAQFLMTSQQIQGAVLNDRYGFVPDTLVVHPSLMPILLDSEEVNKVFMNSPATEISPRFTMRYPTKLGPNLDIVMSWELLPNHAIVCKRNTMGFISDEWALNGSPTEFDQAHQQYSTYFTRRALIAVDTPRAVVLINGINGTLASVP